MERLQEEVERSQQECCEHVSGCDDGWLSKCSSLLVLFAASIWIGKFESPSYHFPIFFL